MTRLYSIHANRVRFISLLFFIFSLAILVKMLNIQLFQAPDYRKTTHGAGITERSITGTRGQIFDRNGQVLAETVKTYTFWVNAHKNIDKERIANLFSTTLNKSINNYYELLIIWKLGGTNIRRIQ